MQLSGNRAHYGTAGAEVHLVDVATHDDRDSTVQDLHDAARIADALDNIHFVQRPMVCRDIADNREMDLNTLGLDVIRAACIGGPATDSAIRERFAIHLAP